MLLSFAEIQLKKYSEKEVLDKLKMLNLYAVTIYDAESNESKRKLSDSFSNEVIRINSSSTKELTSNGRIIIMEDYINPVLLLDIRANNPMIKVFVSEKDLSKIQGEVHHLDGIIHDEFDIESREKIKNYIDLKSKFPFLMHAASICSANYASEYSTMLIDLGFEAINFKLDDDTIEVIDLFNSSLLNRHKLELSNDDAARVTEIRDSIIKLDKTLVDIISLRDKLVSDLADIKNKSNMEIVQPERWKLVIENILDYAEEHNINKEYIFELFTTIHKYSILTHLDKKEYNKE